jgi:hypothetical protein
MDATYAGMTVGTTIDAVRSFLLLTEDQPAASRRPEALADQYAQLPSWVGGLFPGFSRTLISGV